MNVLAETQGKLYAAIAIDSSSDFVSPFLYTLFPCMIRDLAGRFNEAQRSVVARILLQAGCRYTVCGGQNCETCHDVVDAEFVRQHMDDPDEVREALHVMTTWHTDESADGAARRR